MRHPSQDRPTDRPSGRPDDRFGTPGMSRAEGPWSAGAPITGGSPEPSATHYGPQNAGAPRGAAYPPAGHDAIDPTERSVAIIAHLSTLIALLVSAGWLTFVGPLVIWAIYKDKSPFVRQAAAGAFNFSLGCWVAGLVAWVAFFSVIGIPLAIIIGLALLVVTILFPILGAVRANNGERYRYPFQIPVLN